MKKTKQQYRQGDVLIERIGLLPSKRQSVAREGGRLILAHGASTGHSHAIKTAKCELFTVASEPGSLFLEVRAACAELVHDEHTTIKIPTGKYRVVRQREFSAETVRRVED